MRTVTSSALTAVVALLCGPRVGAQTYGEPLTAMPRELEIKYALSALPPHLRDGAAVYVLDLAKGYVLARRGTNGFSCFVARTEYSRAHFGNNLFIPVGYDAEGSKSYLPVYFDVARLRIEGKISPEDLKSRVETGLRDGTYHSPTRSGVAYMLAPIITAYHGPGSREVMTVVMPHVMFYAPNLTTADFGGGPLRGIYPYMFDQGPLGYMIVNLGATETAELVKQSAGLMGELCAFRPDLCVGHKQH